MAYNWSTLVSNSSPSGKITKNFWDSSVQVLNDLYRGTTGSASCTSRYSCPSNYTNNGSQRSSVDGPVKGHYGYDSSEKGNCSHDTEDSDDGSFDAGEDSYKSNKADYTFHTDNCCVPKGTLITINYNLDQKKVEELESNDTILSYDLKEKVLKLKKVKEIHQPVRDHYVKIYTKNNQILTTTKDHALYTDQGWAAYSPEDAILHFTEENDCKRLIVGSKILSHDLLYDEIIKIEYFDSEINLYNLVIEDTHCYFAEKLLLHNKICESIHS